MSLIKADNVNKGSIYSNEPQKSLGKLVFVYNIVLPLVTLLGICL